MNLRIAYYNYYKKLLTLATLKLKESVLRPAVKNLLGTKLDYSVHGYSGVIFFKLRVDLHTFKLALAILKLRHLFYHWGLSLLSYLSARLDYLQYRWLDLLFKRRHCLFILFLESFFNLVVCPIVSSVFSYLLFLSFILLN